MISNNKSKNLKQQIQKDLKKLNQYQSSYIKKLDLYYKFLENNVLSPYEEIKQDVSEALQTIKMQLSKIERAKAILQKRSYKTSISKSEILKYNTMYKEINQNFEKNLAVSKSIFNNLMCVHPILVENNDTLLISEKENQVVFPYTTEEIEEIRRTEGYLSADEVIKEKFMRPLSDFRFPRISRYKETMKLIIEREGYSVLDGMTLAMEMMGKRYLHPAIIAACRTLDELDVYLDCLDKGETEDFRIFKIQYDLYPLVIKENSVLTKFQKFLGKSGSVWNKTSKKVDIKQKK